MLSVVLSGEAQWTTPSKENKETCIILLVEMQVYWGGQESACGYCDYDLSEQLFLGNVNQGSLVDIYNSKLSKDLWLKHENRCLPRICKSCTFPQPLSVLNNQYIFAFLPRLQFILLELNHFMVICVVFIVTHITFSHESGYFIW